MGGRPGKKARGSDIPTQFSDSNRGGGNKDTLGSGKGKREKAPAQAAKDSDDLSAFLDEDVMDTSETLAGKRERAPAEGVMDSDIPTHSIDTKCRLGNLHFAFVMDKDVVKGHAQCGSRR